MKKIWDNWLKEACFLYCGIYTITTILNSVLYLVQGYRDDPNGNWHELTRAAIVAIGVLAYELAVNLKVKNVALKSLIVYAVTMPLVLLTVWLSSFADPLSPGAFQDIFVNYTGLFVIVSVIAVIRDKFKKKQ